MPATKADMKIYSGIAGRYFADAPPPSQQPLASGQEPTAWQTFDGEGGYDFRQFAGNETYREDYIKRNGEKYAAWVVPLYTHPASAKQSLSEMVG
jgi:hypothetical protein